MLSSLIHFTDQERSPFLANIRESSVLPEAPNLCSEEASLRGDPEQNDVLCGLCLSLHFGSISTR